jgi:hypothetical protein
MPLKGSIPFKRFYLTTELQKKAEKVIIFHFPQQSTGKTRRLCVHAVS